MHIADDLGLSLCSDLQQCVFFLLFSSMKLIYVKGSGGAWFVLECCFVCTYPKSQSLVKGS